MENIFVSESAMDVNHWKNTGDESEKMKIGEIFQLKDSSFSMQCINCFEEFQYYTEFTLHIQEHFLNGDIARLDHIKEELRSDASDEEYNEEDLVVSNVKCEIDAADFDECFDDNSAYDAAWSDEDFETNGHSLFESVEQNVHLENNSGENEVVVEGTDYEKVGDKFRCLTCNYETEQWKHLKEHILIHTRAKDVECPICSKLFATISYVRKHCSRTHNKKITAKEIKAAQPNQSNQPSVTEVRAEPKYLKNDGEKISGRKCNPDKKICTEGVDYKKVADKFECLSCNRQMTKLDHLREHLLTHTSEKNVLCPFCATAFITESYVRKHVNRTHKIRITAEEIKAAQSSIDISRIKQEWAIEKDKKIMRKMPKLNTTNEVREEGTIKCLFCSKMFTKPRYAQKHMRLIHAKFVSIGDVINCQPKNGPNTENINVKFDNCDEPNEPTVYEEPAAYSESTAYEESTSYEEKPKNFEVPVNSKFECFECKKLFATQHSLRVHLKLHSGIKYACPHCNKLFAMTSYVRDHIVIMHGIKRDDIPKESILPADESFLYTFRPNIESFECYLCKNQYRKRNRLREHMQTHIAGPFLCVTCGAIFKSNDTLRHHMERHKANPEEPHQCSECGKLFATRRYMLSHYRTIHLNKKRKITHTGSGSERKIVAECQICEKTFLSQHNYNQHMMVHNRDPNELTCHVCGWQFKERSNLKQHMESHGNNKTSCNICDKVLSIRYLQEHMKIHVGNKEFQCSACGKQFVSKERLRRHMVRHTGEPKYKCDLCPKAYTRSDKLLYHRRTHDQQMTHTCQHCGKGFFALKSLRKHENKHYLEKNGILNTKDANTSQDDDTKKE